MWLLNACFLLGSGAGDCSSAVQTRGSETDKSGGCCIQVKAQPYLMVDDQLFSEVSRLTRQVIRPRRERLAPVVTSGPEHRVCQPYVSVIYDQERHRFRMWYNAAPLPEESNHRYFGPTLAYLESEDGEHWPGPFRRLNLEVTYAGTVIDHLDHWVPKSERFKLVYVLVQKPNYRVGDWLKTRLAISSDGLHWVPLPFDTLFPGRGTSHKENWGDIVNLFYDSALGLYGLFFRYFGPYVWTNSEGIRQERTIRRTGLIVSRDFFNWSPPQVVFYPDDRDPGVTEFYGGAAGVHRRGDLLIGFLKVLRDDLTAEGAPDGAFGVGYTVLTWSRDGLHWERDRHENAFFLPDPTPGAWDHAVAWIDSAVPVGDRLYLYYGGYRWGHKYQPLVDRQIGLVRIPRDRYVALQAGEEEGVARTVPLRGLRNYCLEVNIDATDGYLKVRILDQQGRVVNVFRPVEGVDALNVRLVPDGNFAVPENEPLQLEMRLRKARLFALYLVPRSG